MQIIIIYSITCTCTLIIDIINFAIMEIIIED